MNSLSLTCSRTHGTSPLTCWSFLLNVLEVAIEIAASLSIRNRVCVCFGVSNSYNIPLRYIPCFVASMHALYSPLVVDSEVWLNLLASNETTLE